MPWEEGGPTDITNGVAKCRHGHVEHHRNGWSDRLDPDGTYTVTTPGGVSHTTQPPNRSPLAPLAVPTTARPAPPLPFSPGSPPDDEPLDAPFCVHCRPPTPLERAEFDEARAIVNRWFEGARRLRPSA